MLDWMKKLFKKEEEEKHSPDVLELSHYSYKREQEVQQDTYTIPEPVQGKFRFPMQVHEREDKHEPVQEKPAEPAEARVQQRPPQNMAAPRPIRRGMDARTVVKPEPAHPIRQPEAASPRPVRQPEAAPLRQARQPDAPPRQAENSRRPFRPTEVVSPVFGYRRPSYDYQRREPQPDLELFADAPSVVDAWLIKHGYLEEADLEQSGQQEKEPLAVHEAAAEKAEAAAEMSEAEPVAEEIDTVKELKETEEAMEAVEAEVNELKSEAEEPEAAEEWTEAVETAEAEVNEPEPVAEEIDIVEELKEIEEAVEAAEAEVNELEPEAEEPKAAEEWIGAVEVNEAEMSEPGPAVAAQEPETAEKLKEIGEAAEAAETMKVLKETEAATEAAGMSKAAENQDVFAEEAPELLREKKRFVPYNVVMLKQDKRRMQEKQPAPACTDRELASYKLPNVTLLEIPPAASANDEDWVLEQQELLNTTFRNFNVGAKVIHVTQGPAVTRFEVQPEPGVKVNKITNLADDIKLYLAARDIRIEAPIPGKNAVGIEVPNRKSKPVFLREILRSPAFVQSESPLTVALGLDISGTPIVTDIRKMPHGLIAGSTGSGKSVCINAILTSILYKAQPHEVKLMLIDPKMVELAPYNAVPHLVAPVITDAKAATAALKWAVEEMERRYELFAHAGARDLTRYNALVGQGAAGEALPYLVIVIDELADLMMVSPADVEEAICRIAQKARACGIHLLVATQRPSVDVITGLIKANIPTRIAFTVSSQVDSRTIIDIGGAEKLLGRGDMLFLENGTSKPVRVQGVYVSDDEIERTVLHVKEQQQPNYLFRQDDLLKQADRLETEDELFYEACQFVLTQGGASTSLLQRQFRIGYNRAARLIEEMEGQGIISQARGTKPRDVLITEDELAALQDMNA